MKILIVDDEEIIRRGIRAVVDHSGLPCVVAGEFGNGQSAVEYVRQNDVDLVISDIKMPQVDGIQLAGMLSRICPATAIVILSGYSNFTYAQHLFGTHTVSYLLKPIRASELIETLRKVNDGLVRADAVQAREGMHADESLKDIVEAEEYVQYIRQGLHSSGDAYQSRIMLRALDYIHTNIAQGISLNHLADALNFNQSYFSKMFKRCTGNTFCEYVERVRVDAAKAMLLQRQDLCIYEISETVGYRDAKYFSQVFRRSTGYTPGEYREQGIQ